MCDAGSEGTLAYDSDRKLMVYCNGSDWNALGGSFGGGGSSLWLEGATAGEIFYNAGNVGIGTIDPVQKVDVAGDARVFDSVDGTESLLRADGGLRVLRSTTGPTPTVNGFVDFTDEVTASYARLAYDEAAGSMWVGNTSGSLKFGVGTPVAKARLDVNGTVRIGNGAELCNVADHEGGIRYVAATDAFEMCRSSATGWEPLGSGSGGGDNLGDHTATQDLAMAGFKVGNTSAVGLKLTAGNAPVGTPGGGGVLPALASSKIWVGDAGGAAAAMSLSGDATLSSTGVLTIGSNAIGSAEVADGSIANADLAGSIALSKLTISGTGSASNFLRGDGSWQTVPSGADNLGNHTATAALNMAGFGINSIGALTVGGYPDFNYGEIEIQGTQSSKAPFVRFHRPAEEYGQIRYGTDSAHDNVFYLRGMNANSAASINAANGSFSGSVTASTFSGSGTSLTALNASNLSSGSVPAARLGSGTANNTTYLRGDGTWATPSGGGSVAQGTHCGLAVADGRLGDINYYGCGQIFTWNGQSIQSCSGTSLLSGCPGGYSLYQYMSGMTQQASEYDDAYGRCMRICIKS